MNALRYARQQLIKDIEAETHSSLICYVSPIPLEIDRTDVVAIVDLLHNITRHPHRPAAPLPRR